MYSTPAALFLLTIAAIAVLVYLVTWRKMNAFLALFGAALLVGIGAGISPAVALKNFQGGMGETLGGIAAPIALGAMLGKLLAESGAAQVMAAQFSKFFGPARAVWCVVALAVFVGLVTWFAVGLLLLLPVVITLCRETRQPFLLLALPLLSVLSVMHGLTPPHPGPVVAIQQLEGNTGKVLILALLIGLPIGILAGPVFARWVLHRVPVELPEAASRSPSDQPVPGFGTTMFIVVLPIALMMLATAAELLFSAGSVIRSTLAFTGHPSFALAFSFVVATAVLRRSCHFTRARILEFTEHSVAGIGMTLLVVGAGGGFARVLREAGVANALGDLASGLHLPPLLYGWLLAAFIRVATGSATVAITAAAGVLVPFVTANPQLDRELLILSIGCGSLFLSHLNDGGFWIVKDSLGLTVGQTLRTWTVIECLIGILGLIAVLLLDRLI